VTYYPNTLTRRRVELEERREERREESESESESRGTRTGAYYA
jgi:hypothetical protein